MASESRKLITIRDLEGVVSPHDGTVKRAMEVRKKFLEGFEDVAGLARHIGGNLESLALGETWAIKKEFFPGIEIHFVFAGGDNEFPSSLRVLFSGANIRGMHGEDMADAAIFIANYMVEYVQKARSRL